MDSPPLIPVGSPPPPPGPPLPSRRSAQVALGAFFLLLVGLLVFRGYGNRLGARPTDEVTVPPNLRLDLNTSDRGDLEQIPGLGPKLAGAIAEHRKGRGPFRSVDDLRLVHGFGPATVEKVRPFLRVDGTPAGDAELVVLSRKVVAAPTDAPAWTARVVRKVGPGEPPVNVNAASVDDLQRLPMVGPTLAQRIAEKRAAAGPFATVDDLRGVKGVGKKTLEALRPFAAVK